MTSVEPSHSFPRPPVTQNDSPLSPSGRFNRLSYIGWYGLLNLAALLSCIAISLAVGIFNLNTWAVDESSLSMLGGMASLGFLAILLIYGYLNIVLIIRRLHDLNQSGWMCLLFLVPFINMLFSLYLLLAPGTAGSNLYGSPRASSTGEKVMAWLIIILGLLGLFSMGSMMSYMMDSQELEMPSQMMQRGSKYF